MTVNTDQDRTADSVMACPPVTASLGMRLIGDEEVATITLTQHDQAVILHCADQAHAARIAAAIEALPAAPAVQGESESSGLYAVYLRDNWDGEGDTYWLIARRKENGVWVSEGSGEGLIKYEGDELLKIIPLDATPQPAEQQPAPDVAGLVEALEAIQKVATHESVHTGIQAGVALGLIAAICDAALAAHRSRG